MDPTKKYLFQKLSTNMVSYIYQFFTMEERIMFSKTSKIEVKKADNKKNFPTRFGNRSTTPDTISSKNSIKKFSTAKHPLSSLDFLRKNSNSSLNSNPRSKSKGPKSQKVEIPKQNKYKK